MWRFPLFLSGNRHKRRQAAPGGANGAGRGANGAGRGANRGGCARSGATELPICIRIAGIRAINRRFALMDVAGEAEEFEDENDVIR